MLLCVLTMLIPVFSLQLNTKVQPRTLAVGKFNGKRSCLVGATAGNKVEKKLIMKAEDLVNCSFFCEGFCPFIGEYQFALETIRRQCSIFEYQSSGH